MAPCTQTHKHPQKCFLSHTKHFSNSKQSRWKSAKSLPCDCPASMFEEHFSNATRQRPITVLPGYMRVPLLFIFCCLHKNWNRNEHPNAEEIIITEPEMKCFRMFGLLLGHSALRLCFDCTISANKWKKRREKEIEREKTAHQTYTHTQTNTYKHMHTYSTILINKPNRICVCRVHTTQHCLPTGVTASVAFHFDADCMYISCFIVIIIALHCMSFDVQFFSVFFVHFVSALAVIIFWCIFSSERHVTSGDR